jgi:hypothetical protein
VTAQWDSFTPHMTLKNQDQCPSSLSLHDQQYMTRKS